MIIQGWATESLLSVERAQEHIQSSLWKMATAIILMMMVQKLFWWTFFVILWQQPVWNCKCAAHQKKKSTSTLTDWHHFACNGLLHMVLHIVLFFTTNLSVYSTFFKKEGACPYYIWNLYVFSHKNMSAIHAFTAHANSSFKLPSALLLSLSRSLEKVYETLLLFIFLWVHSAKVKRQQKKSKDNERYTTHK